MSLVAWVPLLLDLTSDSARIAQPRIETPPRYLG
jgi:hypothetical protein